MISQKTESPSSALADLLDEILGRREELDRLMDAVDAVPTHGSALLVRGEAGIGKSMLLEAVRLRGLAIGLTVLQTIGMESEAHMPYSGLREILHPLIGRAHTLPGPQRLALLAALGEADSNVPPEPFLIALAALNLLSEAAAQTPVLIVTDDLQWLDQPSHEALAFLARRIVSEPIVVVGALREGHDSPVSAAGLDEVVLRGLDDEAARALVGRHGVDLTLAEREQILQHALGNPLALVELPASRRSVGDPDIDLGLVPMPLSHRLERAFASRLDTLPQASRDVLLVAAVSSEGTLSEILAAARVLSGHEVGVDAVTTAVGRGLLRHERERLQFRHPLVRSGILQSESMHRCQAAHRALAEVLADEPYRRTWHRAQATIGKDDGLADDLEATHLVSLRRGSVATAIAALERAAQLTTASSERGRRLLLAAEHAFTLGRADMVDRLLRAAGRNTLTDLELARMEWLREIFNDGVPGDSVRVIGLCDSARRAERNADPNLALNLLLGAALRCWWADAGTEARELVVRSADELDVSPGDPRLVAILAVADPNRQSRRVRHALTGIALETISDADHLRLLGMAAHAVGDPVLSVDFLDRAERRMREEGRLGLLSHVLTMGIADRIELGDLARAEVAGEEARQIARETGQPIWDIGTLALQAMLWGVQGRTEEAHRAAAEAEQLANGRRLNNLLSCVQLARGFAYCSSLQYAEAYSALRRIFDPGDPAFHELERFHGIMYLAEAAAHSGQHADALTVVNQLRRLMRDVDSPMLRMQLLYADAVLAGEDDAEDLYRRALAENLVRWPLLKARVELAFGSWLRRQKRITESRVPLRGAQVTFEVIGAKSWAEQSRNELRASGERTTEQQLAPASEVLSAQELQIAQLVSEGLSNKEIGERLYLSPRTIGSHLYRMFPKLGITSRGQVASRLHGTPALRLEDA